ncbi:MAG: hypothetical protein WCX17_00205 [Parcubacteria group bacterium]|jgi:hypothetical protein
MKKEFTLLIVVSLILGLVGFSTAFATTPSTENQNPFSQQIMTAYEGVTKAAINGQTIDTAYSISAGKVEAQKIEVQKTGKAETKAPLEIVAAEHVPKYTLNRSEGTAAEANYIVIKSEMDIGGMGGIALIAWQNGGGPTVGTAQMAIAIRNTWAHTDAGFVLV